MMGEDLPESMYLVRKTSCLHVTCVAPGCFEKITDHDHGVRVNKDRKYHAIS